MVFVAMSTVAFGVSGSATVQFLVLNGGTGKPVKGAMIVFRSSTAANKHDDYPLKTQEDGTAQAAGVPYGKIRIVVTAPGFKTYSQFYRVSQPNQSLTITLQKP
jgi:Carboxypeptidase regulatory-like domain